MVAVRVGGAFLVLAVPCLLVLLREGLSDAPAGRRLVVYGVVAVAGAQLCYFNAVQYLSVGVALLLEYLAPVLLIGWHWWRTKTPPTAPVIVGAGVAMAGMVLVLDLFSGLRAASGRRALGARRGVVPVRLLHPLRRGRSDVTSSPLLMTTVGTGVGAGVLLLAGGIGLVPFAVASGAGRAGRGQWPWWLPILLIVLVSAVFAYLSGITAVRRLGSSLASFVALTEVIFAVVFALILLGQRPSLGPTGRRRARARPASPSSSAGRPPDRRRRDRRPPRQLRANCTQGAPFAPQTGIC